MTSKRRKKARMNSARRRRDRMAAQMPFVDVLDLHLAVVSGEWKGDGHLSQTRPVVYGTAFPILPGVLATAQHVVANAKSDGEIGICHIALDEQRRACTTHQIAAWEEYPEVDFALMHCPSLEHLVPLPISFDRLGIFDEVLAVGFPFAIDPERLSLVHRGFRGHIVTRRELYHVKGQPAGYELSFVPPKGLSGAPLVSPRPDGLSCHGYIIQQQVVTIEGQETRLGLAVTTDVLLSMKSGILGGRPLATAFGRAFVPRRTPTPIRNPLMIQPAAVDDGEWPDDLSESSEPGVVTGSQSTPEPESGDAEPPDPRRGV